jgi:hypothetical protein
MNNSELSTKAMLVSLHVSVWSARKFDKKVTGEVAEQHNTTDKAGRYNKNLLPIEAPTYKAVQQIAGEARTEHYKQTLPWTDEGARILPALNYMSYTAAMRQLRSKFENAKSDFIFDYPNLSAKALQTLNGLGNPSDYPKVQELPNYFEFDTKVVPFPDAADFRVTLQQVDVDSIRQQIEADSKQAVQLAMRDPFKRLFDAVSRMVERLSTEDAIFRDSLVSNLEELVKILPSLNLTQDPELDAICKQVEANLLVNPDTLRTSKTTRADIAAKAKLIQDNLAGYMS